MVIHYFKDGTVATELKDVYVPDDIMKSIYAIVMRKNNEDEAERKRNEKVQDS